MDALGGLKSCSAAHEAYRAPYLEPFIDECQKMSWWQSFPKQSPGIEAVTGRHGPEGGREKTTVPWQGSVSFVSFFNRV